MRDRDGNPVQNAHLISLFNKVCKLLFYRIKPVFVFDGGVPALKKKTLAGRKERKEQAERESQKTAKKMMSNFLKSYAMQQLMGGGKDNSDSISLPFPVQTEPDMFELPPLPIRKDEDPVETDSSEEEFYQSHLQNLNDVDIDSADFKDLPSELQHEILTEMKETRKRNFLARMAELPEDSSDFSSYQMKKLLHQNKLSSRIEDIRKDMNERQTGEITQGLGEDYYGSCDVESRRVVSDDTSHYILIKGLAKKRKQHAMAVKKEEERLNDLRKYFEEMEDEKDTILPSSSSQACGSGKKNEEENKMSMLPTLAADIYGAEEPQPGTSGLQLKQADFQSDKGIVVVLDDDSDEDIMVDDTNQGYAKEKIMNWVKATQGQGSNETRISMASGETDPLFNVGKDMTKENNLDCEMKNVRTDDHGATVRNGPKVIGDMIQKEEVVMETCEDSGSSTKVSIVEEKETNSNDYTERPLDKDGKNLHNLAQKNVNRQNFDKNDERQEDFKELNFAEPLKQGAEALFSDGKINKTNFSDKIRHPPEKPLSHDNLLSSNQVDVEASLKPAIQESSATEGIVTAEGVRTEESSQREGTVSDPVVVPDEEDSDDDGGEFIEIPEMSADITFTRSLSQVNDYADEGSNVIPTETEETKMEEEEKAGKNFRAQLEELTEDGFRDFQYELQEEAVTLQTERGKQARLAVSIGDQIYAEAQELLQLFGLPYLVSPMEAEAQCAYLDLSGQTHGTITDDSDIWLFGGRRVYKNFFNKGKLVEFFKIEDCVSQFGLDRDKLINIALLCGSDYTYGIKGVGPVTAMEIMAEFPGQQQEGLKAFKFS
ncbi:DNA excision repair protein ERCC-5-like isoform X2 [Liolophura sinensis]|uniref:DNA excision repair protein ERCC-5-like isoform X2 n=1 Tax=Liolophura sinensis TaxID=3198878 RepID=UPI003158284D